MPSCRLNFLRGQEFFFSLHWGEPEMHNNNVSEFVEALRWWLDHREGLSPTGLAKQAGLDKTAIRQIIEFDRSPRIDTAMKICAALGVSLDQFLARDDDARRSELMRLLALLTDDELDMLQAAARGIAERRSR